MFLPIPRSAVAPLALVLAFAALPAPELDAQSAQPISLQVSGLGVLGSAFTGMKDGIGAEAQIRYTPSAFSVGAGFEYTNHGFEDRSEDIRLYGGFVEPRYRIHAGSNVVAPYLSARFSLLKVGFSGGDLSLSSSFIQLNGGGGLLFRVGSRVNLDVGATYGYNRLGDGTLSSKSGAGSVPVESSSSSNVVLRVGLAIGLGG
jgi:hypothetical protein